MDAIPEDLLFTSVLDLFNGDCPQCGGAGPVDVERSYFTWSAVFFSSTETKAIVACRSCGNRSRIRDTILTAGTGWWAIPIGVFVTPITIGRNLFGCRPRKTPEHPSEDLERVVVQELVEGGPLPPAVVPPTVTPPTSVATDDSSDAAPRPGEYQHSDRAPAPPTTTMTPPSPAPYSWSDR